MSLIVKIGKKVKRMLFGEESRIPDRDYVSLVRRIDRVAVEEKVCAMTFDDGPCALPPSPNTGKHASLTEAILSALTSYGATATFDIIGDTSENYPDVAGEAGRADWGGVAYDHYPYLNEDAMGGAVHQPELVKKMLEAGCELSNHAYRHVLFGRKSFVYGKRHTWHTAEEVLLDAERLHRYTKDTFDVTLKLARPPHYVDRIGKLLTSYDVYERMGYQYMGASFDGAGWLPLDTYAAEVSAMTVPIAAALAEDKNALCGQIIFGKDGYNMAFRSPVADALPKQLKLLTEAGYRVVTVSELMSLGQFSDVSRSHPLYADAEALLCAGRPVAYRDNTLRPEAAVTVGEMFYMLSTPENWEERYQALSRGENTRVWGGCRLSHPYGAGALYAAEHGIPSTSVGRPLTVELANRLLPLCGIHMPMDGTGPVTRAAWIHFLAACDRNKG
ncbi:MAG: polysaccharide deacetylase family protein [Clostridia bacterium]|nr:polysaccharide deacetylase family protein [Clostridia bacterium]